MDYFSLGSKLGYPDLNAIVYLLRKFKRLTSDLRLGSNRIESDYGVYNVTGGLTSVGGNFILEDDVTISSSDVLLNCFYTFYFTVVDVNLSGTVNRRVISVTGDTGDNGILEVVLEPSLLESDEVILPDFKVDIVFDEHEYYTPVSSLDITLEVDKSYISVGEVATVTATVLDGTGTPVSDLNVEFNFNGDIVTDTTGSDGIASAEYTGTGAGLVNVSVMSQRVKFYDGTVVVAKFTGDSITLGYDTDQWLGTTGDVLIDWGDGTSDTVNNPTTSLSHTYTDGEQSHSIVFLGTVTSLGDDCFRNCTSLTSITIPSSVTSLGFDCFRNCTSLTSITIPSSVTSLGDGCFWNCTGLTSITIHSSVTSLGLGCFQKCSALVDYQLYWTGNSIIFYDSGTMPNNTNTVFTIPYSQTSNYIAKGYPSSKLVERDAPIHTYSLSIASDKQSILTTESVTLTGTLLMDSTGYSGQSVALYDGATLVDTLTTDSNGEYSKTLTGLSAGTHTFKAVNTNAESSTVSVTVSEPTPVHNYSLSVTGTAIIQTGDNDIITATLKDNGVVVSGETLNYQIKHGSTVIDSGTDTTDSNGEISISYTGTGVGDVSVIISYGSLLQETYEVQDCYRYDPATTDKTSSYGSIIAYRSGGSGAWNYNSSNGYYGTISGNNEAMVTLSELTGQDDFTVEYDALFNANVNNIYGISGICAYENNDNYSRISCHSQKTAQRVSVNGSVSENETNLENNINRYDLVHFKFTISNNQIIEEVTKGTTHIGTRTISYTPTNATKFGIAFVWSDGWTRNTYLKNIKVKAL